MQLENCSRRSEDIEGLPIKFKNGEEFLIPLAPVKPRFEKKDDAWRLVGEEYAPPIASHLEFFRDFWTDRDDNPASINDADGRQWVEHSGALQAEALSLNYDLSAEDLSELCDPTDTALTGQVMYAVRIGNLPDEIQDDPDGTEKKKE